MCARWSEADCAQGAEVGGGGAGGVCLLSVHAWEKEGGKSVSPSISVGLGEGGKSVYAPLVRPYTVRIGESAGTFESIGPSRGRQGCCDV